MSIDENAYNQSNFIGAVWRKMNKQGKYYYQGRMRNPNDLTENGEFPVVMFATKSENKKSPAFVFKKSVNFKEEQE